MCTHSLDTASPILMAISDARRTGPLELVDTLVEAAKGGAQLIQLRQKGESVRSICALAQAVQSRLPSTSGLLINDRIDIAMAVGAKGVHLPEQGLPVSVARQMLGTSCWVGRSVHSLDSALRAAQEGVDYLVVGTMFSTQSKPGKKPEGIALLTSISEHIQDIPLLAVGGIRIERIPKVWHSGARGVAAIGAFLQSPTPRKVASQWIQCMQKLDREHKERIASDILRI